MLRIPRHEVNASRTGGDAIKHRLDVLLFDMGTTNLEAVGQPLTHCLAKARDSHTIGGYIRAAQRRVVKRTMS